MSTAFIENIISSKAWSLLIKIQKIIMILTTAFMITILGIVVFTRYVFHIDFFGYDELALISSFWMYLIGSSYAMYEGTHVKADIMSMLLSARTQKILKSIAGIIQTSINFFVTYLAYQLIKRSIETSPITPSYNIPFWIPQMSILVGFVLMSFYLVIYTIRDIQDCFADFNANKTRG